MYNNFMNLGLSIQIIGYVGLFLSLFSIIPQIIKVYKSKKTDGISKMNYILRNIRIISFLFLNSMTAKIPESLPNIIPAMITSLFIIVLFYYMFKEKRIYFYISLILILGSLFSSIFILVYIKFNIHKYIKYAFVFLGLSATLIGLSFQAVKTFKLKRVKNLSIQSVAVDTLSNTLWMFYWILSSLYFKNNSNSNIAVIRAVASSLVATITSIPLWMHITFIFKEKNNFNI